MKKDLFLAAAFFVVCFAGSAQPVLTAADFDQNVYYVGHPSRTDDTNPPSPFMAAFYATSAQPYDGAWSVPVSSVPNAANFPTATSAIKSVNSSGQASYMLYETTPQSHKRIARGNDTALNAEETPMFNLPVQFNDNTPMGTYTGFGDVYTPYGNYSNVIKLYRYTIYGDNNDHYSIIVNYVATNPYRFIGTSQKFWTSTGGSEGLPWGVVSEYLPYSLDNEAFNAPAFSIFPNPTHGDLSISNEASFQEDIFASVYDILGKTLIANQRFDESMSLRDLSPGVYILKITDGKSRVLHTQKIIKQ